MKLVDGFIFYNELELLKARFEELYDIVDYFILVEGTLTFTGNTKPLYYDENKELFAKYNDKVIHIIINDYPDTTNPWDRETHQRNGIERGISKLQLSGEDRIIISDVDEIVSRTLMYDIKMGIRTYESDIYSLEMQLYYYGLEWTVDRKWYHPKMIKYGCFDNIRSCETIRHYKTNNIINSAGWHISYMGDSNFIINKLKSFSETQACTETNLNSDNINSYISEGKLFFNNEKLIKIPIETNISLPCYFLKNRHIE